MGADFVVNTNVVGSISSGTGTPTDKIISICDGKGPDSIIDFVNAPQTVKTALAVLRKRGNLILVGLFGGSLELSLVVETEKTLVKPSKMLSTLWHLVCHVHLSFAFPVT